MIKRDVDGLIVDDNLDGGDSANRTGIFRLFSHLDEKLFSFEIEPGTLVRHPKQIPWNNPKNFSRDQLIAFAAGCWKQGEHKMVQRVLLKRAKNFFFCQNTERDFVGSTKKPYPSTFINDSGQKEFRWFDYADPLLPHDIFHLILCGKVKWLYPFAPIGFGFLVVATIAHGLFDTSDDEGQIICECVVAGKPFVWLYKATKRDWMDSLWNYWAQRRNQPEVYEMIRKGI